MARCKEKRFFSRRTEDMTKIATLEEVLELLTEQARKGSVTAAAALERALRARAKENEGDDLDRELDRLMRRD
jgi:hypothetical protein